MKPFFKRNKNSISELQKKDLEYNWHPYVQHKTMSPPIVITKGKDAILWDENGKKYIDAIASWWCNPHGHANKVIAKRISQQIKTLEHVLFGGFTHPTAIELSEKLLSILPTNQAKIFYSDNGSTAVEVAIKMSFQYFVNRGEKKSCVIAFEDAFHGDTFAAMAVSGISFYTEAFRDSLLKVERIPIPTEDNIEQVKTQLKEIISNKNPAAFIYEPLLQGAAGMRIYKPEHLDELLKICNENNVIKIADEIMTGFGRTGKLFASNYMNTEPDIICISKALTGGFIPLSVTSCTQKIYDAFLSDDVNKALFHGHTFMANPAGCAAALASIELTMEDKTNENIDRIKSLNLEFAEKLKKNPVIKNIGVLGVVLRFEIETQNKEYYGDFRNKLYEFFIEQGVILRPVGNIIYILPPYCITNRQLKKVYKTILKAIKQIK